MTEWKLPFLMSRCPASWRNFIADLDKKNVARDLGGFTIQAINQQLEHYDAMLVDNPTSNSTVTFYNDAKYALFLLKYGGKYD